MDDDAPKAVDFRDQLTKIAKEYDRDKSPAENLISKKYDLTHVLFLLSLLWERQELRRNLYLLQYDTLAF